MRDLNHPRPHTTTRAARRSPHGTLRLGRWPSVELISAGVVAGYVHDISQRHRHGVRLSHDETYAYRSQASVASRPAP
jgi:hypothetical protein